MFGCGNGQQQLRGYFAGLWSPIVPENELKTENTVEATLPYGRLAQVRMPLPHMVGKNPPGVQHMPGPAIR